MSLYSPVGPGGKRTFQNILTQSTPFRWIIINNYAHCGNVLSPVDPTLKLDEIWSVCLDRQVHGGLGFVDHNRKPDVTIMVMIVIVANVTHLYLARAGMSQRTLAQKRE